MVTRPSLKEILSSVRELEQHGDADAAWTLLQTAKAEYPAAPKIVALILNFARRHGYLGDASTVLETIDPIVLSHPQVLRAAWGLLTHQENHHAAIAITKAALEIEPANGEAIAMLADSLVALGVPEEVESMLSMLDAIGRNDPRVTVARASAYIAASKPHLARPLLDDIDSLFDGPAGEATEARKRDKWTTRARALLDGIAMRERAAKLINEGRRPGRGRGLIVVFSNGSPYISMTATLPTRRLLESGFDAIHLSAEDSHFDDKLADPTLAQYSGCLLHQTLDLRGRPAAEDECFCQWEIDWANGRIAACGINFFQIFFESMCNRFRRYSIDVTLPQYQHAFRRLLRLADRTLVVADRLGKEIASCDYPIRILAGASHLVPAGVFRRYCDEIGRRDNMHFIAVLPSYEHYFNNMTNKRISHVVVEDATIYGNRQRMAVFARSEQFDKWLLNAPPFAASERKVMDILAFDRVNRDRTADGAQATLDRILAARAEGRPVVCIFGKILYDISEPEQGGPAHDNIRHWINDTVEACGHSEALFLIKPHPSEIKISFGTPTEKFSQLITRDLPTNVVLCAHRWFNIADLIPVIDVGIVWAGTTALELGAAGIPCVVCSTWGQRDHPVDFPAPRNRADYHAMLTAPRTIVWAEVQRRRCIQLLDFLSSEEFHIPYPYAQIPMRGIDKAPKIWVETEIQRFLAEGDPWVEKMVRRIIGTDTIAYGSH